MKSTAPGKFQNGINIGESEGFLSMAIVVKDKSSKSKTKSPKWPAEWNQKDEPKWTTASKMNSKRAQLNARNWFFKAAFVKR